VAGIGPAFRVTIIELPDPAARICSSASRSTPVAEPMTSAWASVAAFAAATALLMSLMVWPWPSAPTWTIVSPIASSSGRARATASASPPAMIVSEPSSARGDERAST
jgi:hypothetical protein